MQADENASISEQCIAAGTMLGLVSLLTCWWFTYSATIGLAGTLFGLVGWWTGREGERALVAVALPAFGAATSAALAWNYWQRVFGM